MKSKDIEYTQKICYERVKRNGVIMEGKALILLEDIKLCLYTNLHDSVGKEK